MVEPNGQKGKVGFRSLAGCLALSRPGATLVVRGPELLRTRAYPDGGCNVEVFTCPDYLELETLGPLLALKPGQEAQHVESWHILPKAFALSHWPLVDQLTRHSGPRNPRLNSAAQALAAATAGAILPPAAGKCG